MLFKINLSKKTCLRVLILFTIVSAVLPNEIHSECSLITKPDLLSVFTVGLFSAIIFCFVGVLPSLFIRTHQDEQKFVSSTTFKLLLAFAAGSLFADVFFHLLPEISVGVNEKQAIKNGFYTICSFFLFLVIEKFTEMMPGTHALGTLNLIANFLDNSAHGSTVVGAFQNSIKFGFVALIATVIHEIPHEFSDFALLLRDGYTRKGAVFAQIITAFAGTIGATIFYALTPNNNSCPNNGNVYLKENQYTEHNYHGHNEHGHNSFLLPFTIGGFLYIALVGIIPDILKEENSKISLFQMFFFMFGVFFIFFLTQVEHIMTGYFL